jgi:hypothetical protein
MPADAPVYWDNPDREADEVDRVAYEPYQFSNYKRIRAEPYWKFMGHETREVVLLWRDSGIKP